MMLTGGLHFKQLPRRKMVKDSGFDGIYTRAIPLLPTELQSHTWEAKQILEGLSFPLRNPFMK